MSSVRAEVAEIVRRACSSNNNLTGDDVAVPETDLHIQSLVRFLGRNPTDAQADAYSKAISTGPALLNDGSKYLAQLKVAMVAALQERTADNSSPEDVLWSVVKHKGQHYGHTTPLFSLESLLTAEAAELVHKKAKQGVQANIHIQKIFEEMRSEEELRHELFAVLERIQLLTGASGFQAMADPANREIWLVVSQRVWGIPDAESCVWRVLISDMSADCDRVKALMAMLMMSLYYESIPLFLKGSSSTTVAVPAPLPLLLVEKTKEESVSTPVIPTIAEASLNPSLQIEAPSSVPPTQTQMRSHAIVAYILANPDKFPQGVPPSFQ